GGIPERRKHEELVDVTFSIDADGLLSVEGEVVSTGTSKRTSVDLFQFETSETSEVEFEQPFVFSEREEVRLMLKRAFQMLANDRYAECHTVLSQILTELDSAIEEKNETLAITLFDELSDVIVQYT
ncbi:MAG: hypothetical protein ACRC5C_06325, partial [Bacilli bacterium]